MNSLVIPVYKNEGSIPALVASVEEMARRLDGELEVVFVVDGSPDQSYALLRECLPRAHFRSTLLALSRNFGSFAAIRIGLGAATGERFAVMAADLQEPIDLPLDFFRILATEPVDVVIGTRSARTDPFVSRLAAKSFWYAYRKLVVHDMPAGGVDVFGCNKSFRDELLRLEEAHSSLIALLFWLGFRRKEVSYERRAREHGRSAWTFRRKVNYLLDSVFAFSDLPIKLLIGLGCFGVALSVVLSLVTVILRLTGTITVPGYATITLAIAFFGALNLLGVGLVGSYAWRAYENTKARPLALVMHRHQHDGLASAGKSQREPSN